MEDSRACLSRHEVDFAVVYAFMEITKQINRQILGTLLMIWPTQLAV